MEPKVGDLVISNSDGGYKYITKGNVYRIIREYRTPRSKVLYYILKDDRGCDNMFSHYRFDVLPESTVINAIYGGNDDLPT